MKAGPSIDAHIADAEAPPRVADDLRGVAQLLVHGVAATTDLAEGVHASILRLPRRLAGQGGGHATRGIPRIAYQGVRAAAGLVGGGIDGVLARLTPQLGDAAPSRRREALVAALNGVLGDHLSASGNPLALPAVLRAQGRLLPLGASPWPATARASPRLLVQVHGLCMNHLQWRHRGHDHGERLADALGYTPVHLHYNSGLSIASNGRAFSLLLQQLLDHWPVPIERFVILGHSMGGLVARAAVASARRRRQPWAARLDQLVFLGTPHHGAPLERAGSMLQTVLGLTPWTAPFVRLGHLRSAGIQDLRHGAIGPAQPRGTRIPVQLPPGIRAYAVAGSTHAGLMGRGGQGLRGDGLVPVSSALGEHRDPGLRLRIPAENRLVAERTGHLELLSSPQVFAKLQDWLD